MNFEIFMLENSNFKFIARRQYTGLKNKNGVEIYEGDILDYRGNGLSIGAVSFSLKNGSYFASGDECYIRVSSFSYCETIGNIYENKDLL